MSAVRGHLLIRVEEASGKTNGGKNVWEASADGESHLEAFVKGNDVSNGEGDPLDRSVF